jgi:malonate transporter and related proteins
LPYFGLIFLGLACGRLKQIPDTGLAWMNFFIVYVALPCLFYRIVARTPLEELANVSFVVATSVSTTIAFSIAFAIAKFGRRTMPEATIAGLAGGYGNIGYMGPGLALSTLGPQAAAPVALIFCFDSIVLFSLVPLPDGDRRRRAARLLALGAVRWPPHCAASLHHRDACSA